MKILSIKEIKKFISYFFVGGAAAIVEWCTFALFNNLINTNYNISTIASFIIATYFNYVVAKKTTFKNDKQTSKDIFYVFIVSGIGLVLNIIFMNILIKGFNLPYEMIAKIISTGLVFFWNYISRRLFIYKEK